MHTLKIAIAGAGNRGMRTYGRLISEQGTARISAVADPRGDRLQTAKALFGLSGSQCFSSVEALLQQPKLADALILATQDSQHYAHAVSALEAGYDLLLEKPIAVSPGACEALAETANRLGRKVAVCHVLRYTPFYRTAKQVLQSGEVGEPVNITAAEDLCFSHYAHSYVRGNWGNTKNSTFMLLTKCCHDLDILAWLMDRPWESVSSFGSLRLFRPENAPTGSTPRCMAGCRVRGECPFDCERFYLAVGPNYWHTLTEDQTEDGVRRALRDGRYGRCVFACDNDVADHQLVNIRFAGGATAELIMSGLSSKSRRSLQVTCTKGEIYGILETGRLTVAPFGREPRVIDLETGGQAACRGGDSGLISEFVRYISGQPYDTLSMTGIDASLASHQIAFAAEESRLSGATVHNA